MAVPLHLSRNLVKAPKRESILLKKAPKPLHIRLKSSNWVEVQVLWEMCYSNEGDWVCASGAIFLTKPCKTFPGPISVNKVAPSATMF